MTTRVVSVSVSILPGSTFAAPNNEFLIVRSRGRISISEKKAASILALMLTLSRRDRWVRDELARPSARKTASYPER